MNVRITWWFKFGPVFGIIGAIVLSIARDLDVYAIFMSACLGLLASGIWWAYWDLRQRFAGHVHVHLEEEAGL